MSVYTDDTICAISTASGGAARGMVRISGPAAVQIAARVFETADGQSLDLVRSATALPGRICVDVDSSPRFLACDLFLWPTNRSYTREPVAELHPIGSRPLLESVQTAVCRAGARLAEPGEFTLRAFLAGRLDLTQAEAVLGVIDARDAEELDLALAQLAGGLAGLLHQLREELLQLLAEVEAGLDFVDEDIEFVQPDEVLDGLKSGSLLLEDVSQQMATRHVTNEAPQIALVGPPNVGKSSLFNALVKRRRCVASACAPQPIAALVSPQRGTTRDYLTAMISLDGMDCELIDTAGIDTYLLDTRAPCYGPGTYDSLAEINTLAQALASRRGKRAAIRALCIEVTEATPADTRDCDLIVLTKSDLVAHLQSPRVLPRDVPVVRTSSHTEDGLDTLCNVFRSLLTRDLARERGGVVAHTAERCRESIRLAEHSLKAASEIVKYNGGNELVALELRAALGELGKVVGAVYTDDLLERIFSTFCIGK